MFNSTGLKRILNNSWCGAWRVTGFKTSLFTLFFKFGGNQSKPEFTVDLRGGSVEWASKDKSSKKHVIEVRVSWLSFLYSSLETLKGIVHPKNKVLSSFTHTQIWIYFYCWTQKKVFWRMFGNQTVDGSHWLKYFIHTMEVNGYRQLFGCA